MMKNAQLWKRILHDGCCHGLPKVWRDAGKFIENRIIRSTCIVDTRDRDEYAEQGRAWRWDSYRTVAWPFDDFWVEGRTTTGGLYGGIVQIGECSGQPISANAPQASHYSVGIDYAALAADGVMLLGRQAVFLDKNRYLITDQLNQMAMHVVPNPNLYKTFDQHKIVNLFATALDNVLDTLLMLSCANISLSPRDNSSRDVRTAVNRYGVCATGYRYHVLVVRPPGAKADTPGQEIGNMPRHVCRGHFAEYGPEFGKGLLFGRLAGRFYIPPHVRGDAKNGTVAKDYEVRASV